MSINLSLDQFLKSQYGTDTFGQNVSFAQVKGDVPTGIKKGTRTETGKFGARYYAKDVLGKEYYMPVRVTVGKDTIPGSSSTYADLLAIVDDNGNSTGVWDLPYPVISAAEINVKVVDTELTERDGMVSELINLSGYKISVKGYLVNQGANEWPEDDHDTMTRLGNMKIPIRIDSVLTDVLFMDSGNHSRLATMRNLKFMPHEGVKNVVEYSFELITEVPFNLIDIS